MQPQHPNSPHRRRPIALMVAVSVASALILICCGGTAIFAFKRFKDDQQRSPEGAITEYFDAIRFKNTDDLADVLCESEREHAQDLVRDFYLQLTEAGFSLQTLTWIPVNSEDKSDGSKLLTAQANVVALRDGERFSLNVNYRIRVTKNWFSWYVCGVEDT